MIRNDAQLAAVCDALCRSVRLTGLWTEQGPTQDAIHALKRGNPWSHGEKIMFNAAWDLWNGKGKFNLYEAIGTLDGSRMRCLGTLLIALGDERGALAIDEWLAGRTR